ncbi:MAG: hypothetical protein KF726_03030 [Anaerolineae bacterium]|nr:hypothetical protein [Anaerolineae bacterium]
MSMSTANLSSDLAQLAGMIRYELLIEWRQRRWLICALGICGVELLFLIIFQQQTAQISTKDRPRLALALLFALQPATHLFALLMPPGLTSESMPRDRRWNLGDLLNTLPLSADIYLTGKLLTVLISSTILLIVTSAFTGIANWLLIGAFDVGAYLSMLLLGILPIAAYSGGLTMLLTAGQRLRRQEIMLVLLFNLICFIGLGIGVAGQTDWFHYINPAHPLTMRYYVQNYMLLSDTGAAYASKLGEAVTSGQIMLSNVVAALQLILGWLIVRYWLLRQQ